MKVKSESEIAQLCPTLSDPMDCSLPGSSVHGIFQARVLEWVPLVTEAMKLKDACSLEESSYDQPRQHIIMQRYYFANKGLSSQSNGFSNSHVWM